MQVVVWVAAPAMIRAGLTTPVMTVLLVSFLLGYLPKIYHAARLLRRMQRQSGYIFGTIWWGIALNLMAYFVAAHVRTLRRRLAALAAIVNQHAVANKKVAPLVSR